MSEELESGTSGSIDPVAISLALAGASRAKADAYLDDQRHHLHEQFKQLRLATLSQRLTIALKIATGAVGLAIIAGLGVAIWSASRANGLVVESFSVPPQFAQAGITGEVLSDDLNIKLSVIRNVINAGTLTRPGDVSANRDNDIKVEIPETGISLGQAWHYLRIWFGHERRLRGNLRALNDGKISLSVALDDTDPLTVSGSAEDLDRLEQQAAEHVYAEVEPVNYGVYLGSQGRFVEAIAAAERATHVAVGPVEQANAFSFWADTTRRIDPGLAVKRARVALAIDPNTMAAYRELSLSLLILGHDEEALLAARAMQNQREDDQPAAMHGGGFATLVNQAEVLQALALGDFALAARSAESRGARITPLAQAEYAARAHDTAQSRILIDRAMASEPPPGRMNFTVRARNTLNTARYYLDAATGNWQGAETEARAYIAAIKADAAMRRLPDAIPGTVTMPMLSLALARNGDFKGAHAAADGMPMDCYSCLRARGQIAALEKDWSGADGWFSRAVKAAPSIPFAYAEWGQSWLDRGKPDEAIEQVALANRRGPHFADPLEGWGEALMAKSQSHLALAKFADANKYAPNWGRLHLKWGEALYYTGRKDEARAQFARAAQLDLTPSEKTELARISHV
jgi:tetratricopeptide (TPR) repeat protein